MKNLADEIQKELDQAVKDLRKKASKVKKTQKVIDASLFPKVSEFINIRQIDYTNDDIDINIPHDPPLVHSTLQDFFDLGWELQYDFDVFPKSTNFRIIHPNSPLPIYFLVSLSMEGATCELVKIGEKEVTSMKSIYEIVCKEGAEEKTFST